MMCMAPAGTMSAASTGTAQERERSRRSPGVNLVFNRKTSLQKNEQPFGCPITGHFCPVIQGLNTAASVFKRCEQVSWLQVITPCAFSGFPNGICMALAVTVTGSLRTCTEFPFHPNGHSHRVVSAIFIPIWFGFIILHRPVAVNCHFTRIACASMRDRPLQAQKRNPRAMALGFAVELLGRFELQDFKFVYSWLCGQRSVFFDDCPFIRCKTLPRR